MNLTDIERLEELEKKATPGGWKNFGRMNLIAGDKQERGICSAGWSDNADPMCVETNEANIQLIAAARNHLPALIRDWKLMRQTLRDMSRGHDERCSYTDDGCLACVARECLKEISDE